MIKLVAFDWNGTILSDFAACLEADNQALKSLGRKPITRNQFREYFDIPIIKFYENMGLSENEIYSKLPFSEKAFHLYYEPRAKSARTRAGARKLLTHLKAQNIQTIIFSNHTEIGINFHLERLSLENFFSTVIANQIIGAALKQRSKGEKLKAFLKEENIKAREMLIVGDTIEEIEIARSIGAISIAITQGYQSTKRLKAAKPDYLITHLQEILKIIKKL